MKPFLYELAESIYKEYRQLDGLTLVFPKQKGRFVF